MKNIRTKLEMWFNKLDQRWQAFSVEKQQRYTLFFFTGYLLLTIGVFFKVWYDTTRCDNKIIVKHIENPVLENKESPASVQDTVVTILKNKIYERK